LLSEKASAVARRPRKRVAGLDAPSPITVDDSKIDWYRDPRRPAIANKLLWLRFDESDRPVKAAFDYFDLNHSNPYHWRILIDHLAGNLFREAKSGARGKTISENTKLLAQCDALPERFKTTPTAMLKELMKRHYRDYNPKRSPEASTAYRSNLRNLRRRLSAALEQREELEYLKFKEIERRLLQGKRITKAEEDFFKGTK
jgi:hypothetical protein